MVTNKLIIFDYDGVLADSYTVWENAFITCGEKHCISYKLDRKAVDALHHINFSSMLAQANLDKKDEKTKKYIDDILDYFKKVSSSVEFFQGISKSAEAENNAVSKGLIEKLCDGKNIICINTANNSNVVRMRLEEEGIDSFISDIAGGDMHGSKSEKIETLMKKYNFSCKDTYMIGDSVGDITEGAKAGVITVAVGYGWQGKDKLLSVNPTHYCDTVSQLEELFCKE